MSIITACVMAFIGLVSTFLLFSRATSSDLCPATEIDGGQAAKTLTLKNEYFWMSVIGVVFSLIFVH